MKRLHNYYRRKKVLVTGGSGFIGSHLTRRLINLGSQITVIDQIKPTIKNVQFKPISITNPKAISQIVGNHYDIIFHLAGKSGTVNFDPIESFAINCLGAINLLEAIKKFSPKTKIIFSNSRQEYGKAKYLPVDENHPTLPTNHYGVQKLAITNYALFYHRQFQLNTVVLRTSNVFGPSIKINQNYNIINSWLASAKQGKNLTIFGQGKQLRDYLYIDDFITALIKIGSNYKANGEIINIGSGQGLSLIHLAKIIAKRFKVKVNHQPWPKDWQTAETGNYVTNISKAKKLLDWQPQISFQQGVEYVSE